MNVTLVPARPSDFDTAKQVCLASLSSPHTRRAYGQALDSFFAWYTASGRPPLDRTVLYDWRAELQHRQLTPSSINVALSAVRRLIREAEIRGLLPAGQGTVLAGVAGVKTLGTRAGNWLTAAQARRLLQSPDGTSLRGRRDRAILALLIGCGLRRAELARLDIDGFQTREDRWVIPDLLGKGNRLRTVPVPDWVKERIEEWVAAAGVCSGRLLRAVNKAGRVQGDGVTEEAIWQVVRRHAKAVGLPDISPHDLRRTCAKLCRGAGGDLEQIQFLLGHASIQTTERYLGSRQNLQSAVNDRLGLGL